MFKGWMENNKATKETQKVQAGIGRKVGITLKDSSPKTKKGKKKTKHFHSDSTIGSIECC